MLKKALSLLSFISLLSCSAIKSDFQSFSYVNSENPWITAFKDEAFFSCLRESYSNNDTIFKMIDKQDVFNNYDDLDPTNKLLAKALGKSIVDNIPPPVMCEGCTEGMNRYMANCLHYYNSRELDSIAHSEYEKFINYQKKIYDK